MNTIERFNISNDFVGTNGENRKFSLVGDSGSKFTLEIQRSSDSKYYNFSTQLFDTTTPTRLKGTISGRVYDGVIKFPAVTAVNTHTIRLFAITDGTSQTKFLPRREVRFPDNTIDLNSSLGSNSNLWEKKLYQGLQRSVSIGSLAPSLADSGEVWYGATHSSVSTTIDEASSRRITFSITVTAASGKSIRIIRQPKPGDICTFGNYAVGAASSTKIISDEDIWSQTAREEDTLDGAISSSTRIVMDADVADKMKVGDRITGAGISDVVTVTALNPDGDNVKEASVSSAISVSDGVPLTFIEPHYHRWAITNAVGLTKGMFLDPNNAAATKGTMINDYVSSSSTTSISDGMERTLENLDVAIPAIVPTGTPTMDAYGNISSQAADVVFTPTQGKVFESQTVKVYAYGRDQIKSMTGGMGVKLSDLKAELTQKSTTVNDASATGSAALSDFDVTSVVGIMDDHSTVRGANILPATVNPTVTNISSSNLTVSPTGHFLENGQTLYFDGASNIVTITGDLEVSNVKFANASLFLDVEKFLTCA